MCNQYGVMLVAVERGGSVTTNPDPDFLLKSEDMLVLLGKPVNLRPVRSNTV